MSEVEMSVSESQEQRGMELLSSCVAAFSEASAEPTRCLDVMVERVATALDCFCIVSLPVPDGKSLLPVAHFFSDVERGKVLRALASATPMRLDSDQAGARAFRTGEVVLVDQPDEQFLRARFPDPEQFERAKKNQAGAVLIAPLRLQGTSLGLLTLVRPQQGGPFSHREQRLATLLAGHAALALRNADLMQALQQELAARERVQSSLSASEGQLRQIFDTADEGIWVADADRRTVLVNRRMAEMMRESPEAMIGARVLDYLPSEARLSSSEQDARRRGGGLRQHIDLQLTRRDGSLLDVRITVNPMVDSAGAFQGTVALITDRTENKLIEEQLRQAQRMESIGRLAGGIAHDFNNLLSVILGLGYLVQEELPVEHPARAGLADICTAGERAARLTRQILAFSRKQVLQPVIVDVNDAIDGLLPMLRRLLGEQIDIRTFLNRDVGRIRVDPGQFEQVLVNLAVNARDAMPGGGRLTFETAPVTLDRVYVEKHVESTLGPHVMIAVVDTGAGMDRETQSRIFEPFFTTKAPGKGTGLGLATVHGIVRQSGGNIWVYSEPGQGTTFKLYFPVSEEQRAFAARREPALATTPGTTATILLVEDEEMLREVARAILTRAGHEVLAAARPSVALELARTYVGKIDLLITDVVMPEMNGKKLAEQVVAICPSIQVLYVSGYTENTIIHDGVLDPGVAYLAKPITPDSLLGRVRDLIGPTSAGRS